MHFYGNYFIANASGYADVPIARTISRALSMSSCSSSPIPANHWLLPEFPDE
jgi:hypothetical protein